ncbi:4Fe-4S dicluster domain-containing protein, partial [Planctomycetota bacterium]
FEITFVEDYSVYDGRFANNAWLQELPDPITKLTWDNAALIAPEDAAQLGVKELGDVIRIANSLEIPAYPVPGHARGSITLPLGYGREFGVVAKTAGVRTSAVLPSSGGKTLAGVQVTATGRHAELALSQDNPDIRSKVGDEESSRRVAEELIKVASIGDFTNDPTFAKTDVHSQPLWKNWSYEDGRKWGMAVDLSACIGCSGCVLACQAENNIPVVGKEEIAIGRDMHWIRVDRYFQERESDQDSQQADTPNKASDVQVLHQPMTCHHCETAPCEQVCPVAATVHDQEGLSVMVYSRCIGTRYCNNNCPFKVRRFNWFWNHHGPQHPRSKEELTEVEKMVHNPEVTVRSRGVMEKCSFCSQRINAVKIRAKNEQWDHIPDGMITPACAQACPTDAIVFGDLNDPESRVRQLHNDPRSYEILPELNLKSRLLYLAKLTNPVDGGPEGTDDEVPEKAKQPDQQHEKHG